MYRGKGCRKATLLKICLRVVRGDVRILLQKTRHRHRPVFGVVV